MSESMLTLDQWTEHVFGMIVNESNPLSFFHANLAPSYRTETLDGTEYLVVPMVMITNGVHAGSRGPVLYPADELKKSESVWNHKPIVVYHPMKSGQHVTACTPDVLTKRKVGLILNTKYDDPKLRAEAWLDRKKLESVDPRILQAVLANKLVEVSTGLWSDSLDQPGTFNAKEYKFVAVNFRPDHLAILPDMVGACSIADGAGLLQTNASFQEKLSLISQAVRERWGDMAWVIDADETTFIYEINAGMFALGYSMADGGGITISTDSPNPVMRQMRYVDQTSGVPILNMSNVSFLTKSKGENMNKTQMVEALVANTANGFTDQDKTWLMNQEEGQLKKMLGNNPQGGTQPANPDPNKSTTGQPTTPDTDPKPKPGELQPANPDPNKSTQPDGNKGAVGNPQTQPAPNQTTQTANAGQLTTVGALLANADPELAELLTDALSTQRATRVDLINKIVANSRNPFTREQLAEMKTDALRGIAALAETQVQAQPQGKRPTNFAMASTPAPTTNAGGQFANGAVADPKDPDYLPRPKMTFNVTK